MGQWDSGTFTFFLDWRRVAEKNSFLYTNTKESKFNYKKPHTATSKYPFLNGDVDVGI